MEKIIGQFQKNSREVVIARFSEFQGETYCDFRVHAINKPNLPAIPTKKGLCIRLEQIHELLVLVTDACKQQQGWGRETNGREGERVSDEIVP